MNFLLDTDTCVYWLRGHAQVKHRLTSAGVDTVALSVITLAELRYGAAYSQQPVAHHQAIDAFTSIIPIVGMDAAVAAAFGDIKAALRTQGMLIADADLLIGATARTYGLTLVTNNINNFRRISGLQLETWV